MKRAFSILSAWGGIVFAGHTATISLAKPVAASIPALTGVYWAFDEAIGPSSVFPDASGNGYDGMPMAGNGETPTLVEGVNRPGTSGYGKAVRLKTSAAVPDPDGNPRVLANLPVENNLGFVETSFTGGLWMRHSGEISAGTQTMILMDKGGFNTALGEGAGHFCLFLNRQQGEVKIGFQLGDGEKNETVFSRLPGDTDLLDGQWHHVGFNLDSATDAESAISFWVDGEPAETIPLGVRLTTGNADSATRRFCIGERVTSTYFSTFDGEMDDVFLTEGHFDFKPVAEESP